ncbi:MAG: hypothetical protein QOD92_3188 [Acidimicrobiaceae bacterium]
MSDISQGEGWWQASDHKWYPPEQHPGRQSADDVAPPPEAEPEPTPEPEPGPPPFVITAPPIAPIAPMPVSPPPAAPSPASAGNNSKWVALAVAAAAVVALASFLLLSRDDGKKRAAVASSPSNSTSSQSSSSSSSSSSQLTDAELQGRMLTAPEIGPAFQDGTFAVDNTAPTPCGQPNSNIAVPPTSDLGSQASDSETKAFFREELLIYADAASAGRAFDLGKEGLACTQGTTSNGTRFTFSAPRDLSSDLGVPNSIAIDYQVGTNAGELIAVLEGNRIVTFQFEAPTSVDRATLPNAVTIAKSGLAKLDG